MNYECNNCPKIFSGVSDLIEHMGPACYGLRLKDGYTPKFNAYLCDKCGEKFYVRDYLKAHISRCERSVLLTRICLLQEIKIQELMAKNMELENDIFTLKNTM